MTPKTPSTGLGVSAAAGGGAPATPRTSAAASAAGRRRMMLVRAMPPPRTCVGTVRSNVPGNRPAGNHPYRPARGCRDDRTGRHALRRAHRLGQHAGEPEHGVARGDREVRHPTIKRAYGDWTTPHLVGWKEELLRHAIQPVQQFAYTRGKNATDSALIIDAMDFLYAGNVDGFAIVSSDSDFTPLATRLREAGMTVYGLGRRTTPAPFVAACDRF